MTWSRIKPRQQVHGAAHAKARKQWAAQHDPSNPCVRCGHPLGPMGPWLHLDHHDDRETYRGFAHGKCNTSAGGSRGRAVQKAARLGIRPVADSVQRWKPQDAPG